MKKVLFPVLVLVLIAPLGFVPGASAQGQKVTIELWQHDSSGKISAMASVIEGFNQLYPNVEVVQTVIPYDEYQTKIALRCRRAQALTWL